MVHVFAISPSPGEGAAHGGRCVGIVTAELKMGVFTKKFDHIKPEVLIHRAASPPAQLDDTHEDSWVKFMLAII